MAMGILGLMMEKSPPALIVVVAAVGLYVLMPMLGQALKPREREPTGITPELKRLLGEPPPRRPGPKRPQRPETRRK
jgi:hypothetical protein